MTQPTNGPRSNDTRANSTDPTGTPDNPLDLAGIGIGPFNLSLAALAEPLTQLNCAFYEQRPRFHWHPGLLIDGATLQVPFLADLVTLADPTSKWSFLNHLRHRERLYPFYFAERFHTERAEYDTYCRWVSDRLPALHYNHQVDTVRWDRAHQHFTLDHTRLDADGHPEALGRTHTKNLVLGIGTAPHIPDDLRPLTDDPRTLTLHSADYLAQRDRLLAADHITVIGSGQSGAEIFLDLLRHRPPGCEKLHWLTRTQAFAPMEYSKLGLEHFTPDYTRYFHQLAQPTRDQLLPRQWQLHKAVDTGTLGAIHDELYRRTLHHHWPDTVLTPAVAVRAAHADADHRIHLELEHTQQHTRSRHTTDALVLATGYRERPLTPLLADLAPHIGTDTEGRPLVDETYRLRLAHHIADTGSNVYVQNAERHTHGVGAPDLGLAAWRSAVILNHLAGDLPYPLPTRTAFTTFGLTSRPDGPGGADSPEAARRSEYPAPHTPGSDNLPSARTAPDAPASEGLTPTP